MNDSREHLARIAELSALPGIQEVHLMPFHNTARDKWRALDLRYELAETPSMTEGEARTVREQILALGGREVMRQ